MNELPPLACNLSEAAEILHVSRPTMSKMAHIKGFPGFQVGNRWIINIKGLQLWLDQQCGLLSRSEDSELRIAK